MFKNLTVYRIGPDWAASAAEIEAVLDKERFVACGATQQKSSGWVEPRGEAHAPLVEVVDGHMLLKLMTEQRVVPGSVVKRRTEEIAEQMEKNTGRKPGKKIMKELKEQALLELLPMAFTKQAVTRVWIAPKQRLLMLDCGSQSKADEVVTMLINANQGLALSLIQTEMSPAVAMTHWLGSGEPPYQFTIDRECELKSTDEMKSVVRYARHDLDTDEVKQHIVSGKVPTRVAMTWRDRVSFILTESMQLKKVAFLDVVFEGPMAAAGKMDKGEAFDADAAIATGELIELIPDLLEALGGEQVIGLGSTPLASDAPVPPARTESAPPPRELHPAGDHAPPWDV
ncbi:MAG TPA: recombination-associated protein RdgC [Aquabacterium sp.]|uniref:recombination-associated protein RdgC n=1 Tax=Aquabacterium sp. TaxID=1872578 RepID=UPI002E36F4DE|nr:recombination-associated protein RdgC [Aquabacterium sp.]HEX5355173.1 recombination-associated protein RdgC [Aquabacterium sp.]